jgi:uncharacterized delta-60 repeat protein
MVAAIVVAQALAAPAGLDTSFSGDGRRSFGFANGASSDSGYGVAIQPDGKIVVAGNSVQSGTGDDFAVARLNAGGGLDTSFGDGGRRSFGFANGTGYDFGSGVAIQPDGKIVVAGYSEQSGTGFDFAVARLRPGGGLDQSFAGDGRRSFGFANGAGADFGSGVAIQPDGRIVVAGGAGADFAVARLRPGGGLDQSFAGDGRRSFGFANGANVDSGNDVAIQRDGKIVVAGTSDQSGTGDNFAVARMNPGGGLDQSFAGDGRRSFGFANGANSDSGAGVAIQPDGRIVVAGNSIQSGTGQDFAVARLRPGGGLDTSFSGDGRRSFGFANGASGDLANGVAIQPNGKIVVAGTSDQSGTGNEFAVARLNPGGGLDQSFSGDGRRSFGFANGAGADFGRGVALQPNGRIVVAGSSVQSGTGTDFAVARLLGG